MRRACLVSASSRPDKEGERKAAEKSERRIVLQRWKVGSYTAPIVSLAGLWKARREYSLMRVRAAC